MRSVVQANADDRARMEYWPQHSIGDHGRRVFAHHGGGRSAVRADSRQRHGLPLDGLALLLEELGAEIAECS